VEIADDANDPTFMKFDPSMMGLNQLAITSNGEDVTDFQDDVEDFRTDLERIKGVANVDQSGGLTERFEVSLDPEKLKENLLTQEYVGNHTESHEAAVPGGTVETPHHTLATRVLNTIDGKDGLTDLKITKDSKLPDIAEVKLNTGNQTA